MGDEGETIKGYYRNGVKDKVWKTVMPKTSETYIDEYNAGKYVKGKTIHSSGNTTSYDKLNVLPEFKRGNGSIWHFLQKLYASHRKRLQTEYKAEFLYYLWLKKMALLPKQKLLAE